MNFQPNMPMPPFLERMAERVMLDRIMERPINLDEYRLRPVRRRINPVPLEPRGPRTPEKSHPRRAQMD